MDRQHGFASAWVNDLNIIVAEFEIASDLIHVARTCAVGIADKPLILTAGFILDLINTFRIGLDMFNKLLTVRHCMLADILRFAGAQQVDLRL